MADAPGLGHNVAPPFATEINDRLARDYDTLLLQTEESLIDASGLPDQVTSGNDVAEISSAVVKLRDLAARAEAHRVAEKEPHLRAGEAVQAFFMKRVIEPLNQARFDLTKRLDIYKQKQLAEERARRAAEAAAARKLEEEAQRREIEAIAAARRARSAETADTRNAAAQQAQADANIAAARAEEAKLATMANAAKMVGERFEGERSGQVTMRKTPVVFIDDVDILDLEALRPYIKEDALLSALKAWAKATNYARKMPGATIGMRDATVVR